MQQQDQFQVEGVGGFQRFQVQKSSTYQSYVLRSWKSQAAVIERSDREYPCSKSKKCVQNEERNLPKN